MVTANTRYRVTVADANVARIDLETAVVDTLLALRGTEFYFGSGTAGYSYLPLGGRALAVTGGNQLSRRIPRTTTCFASISGPARGRPSATACRASARHEELWDAEARELTERQPLERTRQLLADVLAEADPPDRAAGFVAMFADRAGRLWLRPPGAGPTSRWVVIPDERPEEAATVVLPRGVDPLDARDGRLAAVARDSLGVQSLRVYTLPAGLTAPPAPRP